MTIEEINGLTEKIIGCAFRVHTALGPGLLESTYEHCLCHELELSGLTVKRQVVLPLIYKRLAIEAGYRLDLLVQNEVILEIKSVDRVLEVHRAQLLTYLRLTDREVGLLLNFKERSMSHGIHRVTRELEKARQRQRHLNRARGNTK